MNKLTRIAPHVSKFVHSNVHTNFPRGSKPCRRVVFSTASYSNSAVLLFSSILIMSVCEVAFCSCVIESIFIVQMPLCRATTYGRLAYLYGLSVYIGKLHIFMHSTHQVISTLSQLHSQQVWEYSLSALLATAK